ncbi:MAG: TM1266 family iron-only hydrogenase system putative regulator [Victivallis sp.]
MDAESRIAIVSMIVEDTEMSAEINRILHEYRDWLVGRMGIPYKQQNVAVICVVVDAPANVTSSSSSKLGMLPGISVKTVYSKK